MENSMLVPLNDRVIVKRSEAETQTKPGLILPSSSQEKPNKGEVIATASEHVAKGDIVFLAPTLEAPSTTMIQNT